MRQLILLSLALALTSAPALAEWRSADEINRNWDAMKKPGPLQVPKDLQQCDAIMQQPKDLQKVNYVTGEKAIQEKTKDCNRRFIVGSDCLFNFGESSLTKDAEDTLKVLGPKLQRLATHPITIEGHTDSIDTDEKNQILSEKRAARVRNWLLENHFIPAATKTLGHGEKNPVAANTKPDGKDNPEGRALNRRVEIIIDTCTAMTPEQANTPPGASAPVVSTLDTTSAPPAPAAINLPALLPYANLFTSEEIHAGFNRLSAKPFNDSTLAYEVLAPTDWTENPPQSDKAQLEGDSTNQITIGRFNPKDTPDVTVEIRYIKAADEANLGSFVRSYAARGGYEILGRQPGEFNGRQVEDALLKTSKNDSSILTRMTVSQHNGRIFVVASSCPEQRYEQWKKVFGAAAVSFNAKGN